MFNGLRWEVVVSFFHIGRIVDHHCLNGSFHNLRAEKSHYVIFYFVMLICKSIGNALCLYYYIIEQLYPFIHNLLNIEYISLM